MSKYNRKTLPATPPAFKAGKTVAGTTHEGATGFSRDAKTELFLRAASSFAGEKSFYEDGDTRDSRLIALTRELAVTHDGFAWLGKFVPWLRTEGFMRSGPVMIAAEAVKARLDAGLAGGNRQLIDSAMARADEPGEMLGYWIDRFGRNVPVPVKRGLADAANRLYTQRSLLKYDTASKAYRFGDVIDLAHPAPRAAGLLDDQAYEGMTAAEVEARVTGFVNQKADLFRYAIDRRHGYNTNPVPESLRMVIANEDLRRRAAEDPAALIAGTDDNVLRMSGMTWEDVLSLAGQHPSLDKTAVWKAVIPSMGYMALLRNLRNFDDHDVRGEIAAYVMAKIADPAEVERSMQFPFRFYSAYREVQSVRWHESLEEAANHSVRNIPELSGKNLVLIDTSGSMTAPLSAKSKITNIEAAALFGAATGIRTHADVWSFATTSMKLPAIRGSMSILKYASAVQSGPVGHGTEMHAALAKAYDGHDRVFIFSDMQAFGTYHGDIAGMVPKNVPIYAFNLNAYTHTPVSGDGKRYELGGLGDATFRLIPLLEAGKAAKWPWEM